MRRPGGGPRRALQALEHPKSGRRKHDGAQPHRSGAGGQASESTPNTRANSAAQGVQLEVFDGLLVSRSTGAGQVKSSGQITRRHPAVRPTCFRQLSSFVHGQLRNGHGQGRKWLLLGGCPCPLEIERGCRMGVLE